MPSTTITFRVDDAERDELVDPRRAREGQPLRLHPRAARAARPGIAGGDDVDIDPQHEQGLREEILDHDRRLRVLEEESAQRR